MLSSKKKKATEEERKGKFSRLPQVDFHINETTTAESGLPTDYSYSQMKSLEGILLVYSVIVDFSLICLNLTKRFFII